MRSLLAAVLLLTACSSRSDDAKPRPTPVEPAATTPDAAPKAKPRVVKEKRAKASKDQMAEFKRDLNQGRVLEKKGDLKGALAAFDAALKIIPDDPRVLGEYGYAAYQAKDLPTAERMTRAAIARTQDANLLGASYYNLGLIFEARGEKDLAVGAYTSSLRVRSNKTVRERLSALDPAAAVEVDTFRVVPAQGPFPDVTAYCATYAKDADAEARVECDPPADAKTQPPHLDGLRDPWQEVRAIATSVSDATSGAGPDGYHLAMRLKDGWYVAALREIVASPDFGFYDTLNIEALELTNGWIVVRLVEENSETWTEENTELVTVHKKIVACGVGASGKPGCTAPIEIDLSETRTAIDPDGPAPKPAGKGFHMTATLSNGALGLAGDDGGKGLLGVHPLVLP
jgi:tetratricopeptide (TPR) repeat protein